MEAKDLVVFGVEAAMQARFRWLWRLTKVRKQTGSQ